MRLAIARLDVLSQPVRIAIVGYPFSSYSDSEFAKHGFDKQSWKDTIVQEATGNIEAAIQGQGYRFIRVIDRLRITRTLEEQSLSFTGAISEDEATKAGKLCGATHILYWTLSRSPAGSKFVPFAGVVPMMEDLITQRLIDAETGEVLATQVRTVKKRF